MLCPGVMRPDFHSLWTKLVSPFPGVLSVTFGFPSEFWVTSQKKDMDMSASKEEKSPHRGQFKNIGQSVWCTHRCESAAEKEEIWVGQGTRKVSWQRGHLEWESCNVWRGLGPWWTCGHFTRPLRVLEAWGGTPGGQTRRAPSPALPPQPKQLQFGGLLYKPCQTKPPHCFFLFYKLESLIQSKKHTGGHPKVTHTVGNILDMLKRGEQGVHVDKKEPHITWPTV